MLKRALVLALVAGCNSTHNPVTAAGTTLFSWDHTKSSRVGVSKATVGARTAKDYVVTSTHENAPPHSIDLHVEVAPLDFDEAGHTVHQTSPVTIEAKVKDNTGWDLSGSCEQGPNYQMPFAGADGGLETPLGMREDCRVSEHRQAGTVFTSSWAVGYTLEIYGDGKIKPFPADGVTVTAR
jgi:hypothetical protein